MYEMPMNNNFGMNPYNPFQQRQQGFPVQPQMFPGQQPQNLIRVTGMDGAKAYQMPPNSSAALFDEGEDIFYVKTTDGAAVPIGNTVPLGSIIRRYGNCISANGSVINIREPGYYDVDISATFTADATGNVTLTLLQDGVPVPGATATATITTATTQVENSAIMATVRVMCCGNSNLSVLVGGTAAPTISNMAVQVSRI